MIQELNILRVLFILFIFLEHSAFFSGGGYLGVALFFLLGGFCMTLGYANKVTAENFSYSKYLLGRFSKFYPLHWICLVAWITIALVSDIPLGSTPTIIANTLLLQSWVPDQSVYFSCNGISWYLADTAFFAAIFPVLIKFIVSKSATRNIIFVSTLAIIYTIACIIVPEESRHAIMYINPLVRLVDFVIGIYAAKAFLAIRGRHCSLKSPLWSYYAISGLCIIAIIAETVILKDSRSFAWIFWPFGTLLIVSSALAGCVRGEKKIPAIDKLSNLGAYTFAFYMIHQMSIQVCNSIAHKIGFEYHFWVMLITLVLTFGTSVICHRYIEKPCSEYVRKRLNSYSAQQ